MASSKTNDVERLAFPVTVLIVDSCFPAEPGRSELTHPFRLQLIAVF